MNSAIEIFKPTMKKRLGISKQILIIAILPALVVAIILSTHYIWDQFDYITESFHKNGELIAKQLAPAAEHAIRSGNIELVRPLVDNIASDHPVLRIQILDRHDDSILDVTSPEKPAEESSSIIGKLFDHKKEFVFIEPILSEQLPLQERRPPEELTIHNNQIGKVILTITNQYAVKEKAKQVEHGILITALILLLSTLSIIRASSVITQPIKSLTRTVRNISSGDLNTHVDVASAGEIGILESCINQMKHELKESQTDLEIQLNVFTDELQQTLEELEIRNAELDITRSKAIYANNAKSEFLANMSHEIRTPLSGIIGFTELLRDTQLTGQQKDYTHTIQKSAKSLLEIINDILDLSKIESGKTEITKSEFNLIDLIEDIINLLSPTALDKNIEIFYSVEKDVATIVHSDHFRIHQILINLISNAIKFTDKGYVYLQVTTGNIKNTENSIMFSVSDTGIGLNEKDKKKLFSAFTQADTSITRRFGGTGLGLVISRKLTLLMKGEIGFDSTEGKGSTFWFCIPTTHTAEANKQPELANKKIAFISDHLIATQSFKMLFENQKCIVSDYCLGDLAILKEIENSNDISIVFLSSKEINTSSILNMIKDLVFTKPSLLIASTRSHSELRSVQQHVFYDACFTSEKSERIKQKVINCINKNSHLAEFDDIDSHIANILDWSKINVMVVDDNEVNLRLAEILLHKHKANVTTARSGAQALEYARMNSFDIVFMDLHMPGIDGYETTQRIREISPGKQSVIIALTANALPQEKEKAAQSGMNGILIKPVSEEMLQKVISQWILDKPVKTSELNVLDTENIFYKNNDDDTETVFSLALAKEFTGDNEKLAYELFNMLRSELESYKLAISTAVKNNDLHSLREQIHKLHGASRCCGTSELKETSHQIEKLITQNISFDIEEETSKVLIAMQNVADYKIDKTP